MVVVNLGIPSTETFRVYIYSINAQRDVVHKKSVLAT
jgi:hypothetical protein